MNALQQFLTKNSVDNITEEVVVSERLKDFKFKIKAMTGEQYNSFQQSCIENPNSAKKRRFNTKKFNELLVVNCVLEPNFKDADWQKANGIQDGSAAALMYKTLLAGEINELADIKGLIRVKMEKMEEVKN